MSQTAHCVVDFILAANDNSDDTINELDDCCFSKGIVRSEVHTKSDNRKQIRLYIMLQTHDPFWKFLNKDTHEMTISYDDVNIEAQVYRYENAPPFIV